jgi:23S rRNA U2552 (ribose-2'-O)-methylase RlmE/FtsJ
MDKPTSSIGFKLMTLVFRVRDLLRPRMDLLKEAGIESGFRVLDYGCDPGSYIAPLAELVGDSGEIYALDIHPFAIKEVQKISANKAMTNVKAIKSDCKTGLH